MADSENEIIPGELVGIESLNADSPDGTVTTEQVRRAYTLWMANQEAQGPDDVAVVMDRVKRHGEAFDAWLEAEHA